MARKTIIRLTESDIHNMVLEAVKEAVKQQFGSSATSINKTKTASGFPFFGGTAVDKKLENQNGKVSQLGKKA